MFSDWGIMPNVKDMGCLADVESSIGSQGK